MVLHFPELIHFVPVFFLTATVRLEEFKRIGSQMTSLIGAKGALFGIREKQRWGWGSIQMAASMKHVV